MAGKPDKEAVKFFDVIKIASQRYAQRGFSHSNRGSDYSGKIIWGIDEINIARHLFGTSMYTYFLRYKSGT